MVGSRKSKKDDNYTLLVQRCPLRPIRTKKQHDLAVAVSDELTDRISKLNQDERDYLELLTDFLCKYEEAQETAEDCELERQHCTPRELLRFLMESNKLSQGDLSPQFGSASRVSDFLNGKRELSKSQVLKLAERFKVSPAFFLEATSSFIYPNANPSITVSERPEPAYATGATHVQPPNQLIQIHWHRDAISRVTKIASAMGVSCQDYIKQVVYRQMLEDEEKLAMPPRKPKRN